MPANDFAALVEAYGNAVNEYAHGPAATDRDNEELEDRVEHARAVLLKYVETTEKERDAWKEFANHQDYCAVCAESVRECEIGRELQRIAVSFATTREVYDGR